MAAYKLLKDLKRSLKETEDMVPVNWLGKWWKSIKISGIKKRISDLECDLKDKKKCKQGVRNDSLCYLDM